jgi:hypothetical protein
MTLQETRPHSAQHGVPSKNPPRLRLTPKDRSVGDVGGAWWPRSRDLGTELPDLLAVLADGLGRVERVVYDPAGWAAAPERLVAGDGAVTLDAYLYESFNKLYVYGIDGASIVLRVIPASTDDGAAHAALMVGVDPSGQHP